MTRLFAHLLCLGLLLAGPSAHADKIMVAAAADLKFALDEIVTAFQAREPGHEVEVVYGSSGKFHTQIQQGAPYDLYFSADIPNRVRWPRQALPPRPSSLMPWAASCCGARRAMPASCA